MHDSNAAPAGEALACIPSVSGRELHASPTKAGGVTLF